MGPGTPGISRSPFECRWVLKVLLARVYQEVLRARVSLGDLVSLGIRVFPVVLFYLLDLSGKAFHLLHRIGFAALEALL